MGAAYIVGTGQFLCRSSKRASVRLSLIQIQQHIQWHKGVCFASDFHHKTQEASASSCRYWQQVACLNQILHCECKMQGTTPEKCNRIKHIKTHIQAKAHPLTAGTDCWEINHYIKTCHNDILKWHFPSFLVAPKALLNCAVPPSTLSPPRSINLQKTKQFIWFPGKKKKKLLWFMHYSANL